MLKGIRVIEMANVISGPFAGMLLGDMGAEIVKIEMPGSGDPFRLWAGDTEQIAPSFAAYNRGKKSITLDIRSDEGRKVYRSLVARADVVIDNFRPGTLDRQGIGPQALCAAFPKLIYCAISGQGSRGPDSARPTYDAIAQGMSGIWSQLTSMDAPEAVGPPISDQLTGLYAANAVLGALVARDRNGDRGQRIEVSMLGASLAFQPHAVAEFLANGEVADKSSRAHKSQSYAFIAGDGKALTVHLSSQTKFWKALLKALDRPDLESDPRFADKSDRHANYDRLQQELQSVFATGSRSEWLDRLCEQDVPAAPIHRIDEALADPQVEAQGLVRDFGSGKRVSRLVGYGYEASGGTPDPASRPVPVLGEHTRELLEEAGYDNAAQSALSQAGTI